MGSSVDGLEGGPAYFAEQPAGEEVTLTSHSSRLVFKHVRMS